MMKRKKLIIAILVLFLLAAAAGGSVLALYLNYADDASVHGNVYCSSSAIAESIFTNDDDTRLLNILIRGMRGGYKNEAFSAKLKLDLKNLKCVQVEITEKAPAAAVQYDGCYLIVTEKGIALGRSDDVPEGLRTIRGLEFAAPEYFTVPETGDDSLQGAVEIVVSLDRFEAAGDPVIYRDGGYFLIVGDVTVAYGKAEYLNEKAEALLAQTPYYEGLKGTLHMENYDGSRETEKFYFTVEE